MKLRNNKKGLGLFDGILVGILLFTFVILSTSVLVNDWEDNYGDFASLNQNNSYINTSGRFDSSFNTIRNITGLTDDVKDNIMDADISEDTSDAGSISSMSKGAFSAIRLIPRSWGIVNTIMKDIAGVFGMQCTNTGSDYESNNCWVVDIFLYIFIITIIFGILYFARGFKTRG